MHSGDKTRFPPKVNATGENAGKDFLPQIPSSLAKSGVSGFGKAQRFKFTMRRAPGPCDYQNPNNFVAKVSALKAPRIAKASRPVEAVKTESETLPGPADYDPKLLPSHSYAGSSAFKSKSQRTNKFADHIDSGPSPADFIISEKTSNRGPKLVPSTEITRKVRLAPCLPPVPVDLATNFLGIKVPREKEDAGPASYYPKLPSTNSVAPKFGTSSGYDSIFSKPSDDLPGPGAYDIPSTIIDTKFPVRKSDPLPPKRPSLKVIVTSTTPGPSYYDPHKEENSIRKKNAFHVNVAGVWLS
jgi:Sperm-tail PG-rich repeat